jgi:hypothetical protein
MTPARRALAGRDARAVLPRRDPEVTVTVTSPSTRPSRTRALVRHYLEMVVAMVVGMVALEPLWDVVLPALGWSVLLERPDLHVLVMATDMTLAMSAWMAYRGHRWRPVLEMAAAMYLPFVVLLVPLWTGLISPRVLFLAGHVLMLAAMAAAMVLRPDEYARHHH